MKRASTSAKHRAVPCVVQRVFAFLLAMAALAGDSRADLAPGAGGLPIGPSTDGPRESHGWVALPTTDGRWELIHLPPEVVAGASAISPSAGPGSVHVARILRQSPQAIAAWERRVYLAFPPRRIDGQTIARDIRALDVSPAPIRGLWQYGDSDRLDALPSLPGRGRLLGFVGTDSGPAALLDEDGLGLWILRDREWVDLPMPERTPGGAVMGGVGTSLGLVAAPSGVGLWVVRDDGAELWTARIDPTGPEPGVEWAVGAYELGAGPRPAGVAAIHGDELVYWIRSQDALHVRAASADGDRSLTRIDGVPDTFAAAAKSGVGALALVWPATTRDARGDARRGLEVREVSLASGRLRYTGLGHARAPISRSQSRLIVLAVLGVTLIILMSAVRQGDTGIALLPEGCVLAFPSRRALATLIDLLPALFLGIRIAGAQPEDFSILALAGPAQNAILLAMGIAWAHTTIGEALWYRSLGKALSGIAVVSVRTAKAPDGTIVVPARRPSLIESGTRNLVKWWLFPIAFIGMLSPSSRHRGDIVSRLAVVAPAGRAS